jgi:glycosyltransferase involved in cell wall biosynthesis
MSADTARHTLTVVIPALNEEEAIEATVTKCLDAVDHIKEAAGLESVEIIVVSDGSTDRTAEIVRAIPGVRLIEFERNRGYGAALKEGFRRGTGSLVAFLDADGTCDPWYFGEMCRLATVEQADVVLGSRMGENSEMPPVRRLGNRLYALLLGFLCGRATSDTASGMRVIRRAALDHLFPLPDGLHFTPAMSARALLNGLRVIEIPMEYRERIGRSKLKVLADGVLFLRAIIDGVLCYRPERIFLLGFTLCLLAGTLLAISPLEFYIENRFLEEWMIYRFLVCGLLGSVGFQLLAGVAVSQKMSTFGLRRCAEDLFWPTLCTRLFEGSRPWCFAGAAALASLALVWPGLVEYVTTWHVTLHWSRFVLAIFGFLVATQAAVAGIIMRVLQIWKTQLQDRARKEDCDAVRIDAPSPSPVHLWQTPSRGRTRVFSG